MSYDADGDTHVGSEDRTEDTSILDSFEIVEIPATLPTAHPHALSAATVAHSLMCSAPMLGSGLTVHCGSLPRRTRSL